MYLGFMYPHRGACGHDADGVSRVVVACAGFMFVRTRHLWGYTGRMSME